MYPFGTRARLCRTGGTLADKQKGSCFAGPLGDGASRTRTGDLLGAIQGGILMKPPVLQGFHSATAFPLFPGVQRVCRDFL